MPAERRPAKARFFRSQAAFREWLGKHGTTEDEIEVGYYKVGSGKGGLTYKQSVDEGLCHGWIDGVRHTIDARSYRIRFTPRRAGSIWSAVNLKRIKELEAAGLVTARGLEVYRGRDPRKQQLYSFENRHRKFEPAHVTAFRKDRRAWDYFQAQPPWYRRVTQWWVVSAKKEETRQKRLATLISCSKKGVWIDGLRRGERGEGKGERGNGKGMHARRSESS